MLLLAHKKTIAENHVKLVSEKFCKEMFVKLTYHRDSPFKFLITSFFTEPGLHWSRFGVFRLNPLLPVTDAKFDRKYCEQSFTKEHWFSSTSMQFSSILSKLTVNGTECQKETMTQMPLNYSICWYGMFRDIFHTRKYMKQRCLTLHCTFIVKNLHLYTVFPVFTF